MNETKLSPVFSERVADGHITDLVADPIEISINNQQLYAFCKEHTVGDILRYAISRSDIGEVACLLDLEFRLHNIKKGHQTNGEVDGLVKWLHDNAADNLDRSATLLSLQKNLLQNQEAELVELRRQIASMRPRLDLLQRKPALAELTDAEIETNFLLWWKDRYGSSYFGAVPLGSVIEWTRYESTRAIAADRARRPAPAEPAEAPTSDEEERFLVTTRPTPATVPVAMDALARLYWWGGLSAEYGYSKDVVLGVRDWINGGMVGDLPPLPAWIADRCPPLLSDHVPDPTKMVTPPAEGELVDLARCVEAWAAQLSNQPLAMGLADALEELVDRTADECDSRKIANVVHEATIQSIINHLRTNNHA